MTSTRRLVVAGLIVFMGFVVFHAVTSYGWKGQTTPPAGVAVQTVAYTCGAPWGADYVHGPTPSLYPLTGTPCGERSQYQVVAAISVLLAAIGLGVALAWRQPSRTPA